LEFGEALLRTGEPLFAYDIATEGLSFYPNSFKMKRLWSFALARSGALDLANKALVQLLDEDPSDEETAGILASTFKDLAAETSDSRKKQLYLRRSFDLYLRTYDSTRGNWNGINAATIATLLGECNLAEKIAKQVLNSCKENLNHSKTERRNEYWVLATLGEASLILGNWSEAEDWYSQAVKHAGNHYSDLITTRKNARLLLSTREDELHRIERCFRIPSVVVFVGHMIDRAERKVPRFPAELADSISLEIEKRLEKLDAKFGFSSGACGSDILFLEAMLKRGGETHIILPYERDQFIQDSIDVCPGGGWKSRFERLVKHATEVVCVSPHRLTGGSILFEYANKMIYGLAGLRSKVLETNLKALAVWDGMPGDGPGGAEYTVDFWRKAGHEVEIINASELLRAFSPMLSIAREVLPQVDQVNASAERGSEFSPEIRSILFADAVGFSKLTEDEMLLFVRHFLGLVSQIIDQQRVPPLLKNTWGDGLYLIFSDTRTAGLFALQLIDEIDRVPWNDLGLHELDIRIGLHAGALYSCIDPVTRQKNYIGSHVSRAARIEPITPPGQIYASQAFAAQAWVEHVTEFRCDYVGLTQMAKNYGTLPAFAVRRPRAV
jgi:class 3 adenylate cyclase